MFSSYTNDPGHSPVIAARTCFSSFANSHTVSDENLFSQLLRHDSSSLEFAHFVLPRSVFTDGELLTLHTINKFFEFDSKHVSMNLRYLNNPYLRVVMPHVQAVYDHAVMLCYDSLKKDILHTCVFDSDRVSLVSRSADYGRVHTYFTFFFKNISRACADQLLRHRTISWNMRSQRRVNEGSFSFVNPYNPETENGSRFEHKMFELSEEYKSYGKPYQKARYVLPMAASVQFVGSASLASWELFINTRTAADVDEEARSVVADLSNVLDRSQNVCI